MTTSSAEEPADVLQLAVRAGDWEQMNRLLEDKADANLLDHDALTALFYVSAQDEPAHAKRLIEAGAEADVPGQSLSPLWAAATLGNSDLVSLLLKAGAEVPLDPLDADLTMISGKSASIAHPAVAAIRSGSVDVLKQLLEAVPNLDLDRLFGTDFTVKDPVEESKHPSPNPYPVLDAVRSRHPEMAEFLIRHGCRIEGPERFMYSGSSFSSHTLVVSAVMAKPPMTGVIAALRERGAPMIRPPEVDSWRALAPWDGLSAALRIGDVQLASELLPAVGKLGNNQFMAFLLLAEASGNEEAVKLVNDTFPNEKLLRRKPGQNQRTLDKFSVVRTFVPRSKPLPDTRQIVDGLKDEIVLAVFAQNEAQGIAAVLATEASAQEGWSVVEREEIEALLKESDFHPWSDASPDVSGLGDKFSANLLIIVSKIGKAKDSVIRLEAVDVASGMLIDRRHIEEKDFDGEEFKKDYLPAIRSALSRHHGKGALIGVTLLAVGADPVIPQGKGLASLAYAGLMQKVDETPGMISLTREQMMSVAEEKSLKESGELWGSAWTLEAGIDSVGGDRIRLGLRLRQTVGNGKGQHDAFAEGSEKDLAALVSAAWSDLIKQIGDFTAEDGGGTERQKDARRTEAARLLREAEWLTNIHRGDEALPLIDAAVFLGADPIRAIPQRARIHTLQARLLWGNDFNKRPRHSQIGDDMTYMLPLNLARLQVVNECFLSYQAALAQARHADQSTDKSLKHIPKSPYRQFWELLNHYVSYRTFLQPHRMNGEQLELMRQFDEELSVYLKNIFATAEGEAGAGDLTSYADKFWDPDYANVPDLAPCLAEALVRCWDHYFIGATGSFYKKVIYNRWASSAEFTDDRPGTSDAPTACNDPDRSVKLINSLEEVLKNQEIPYRSLRLAELAFFRASDSDRGAAARNVVDQWAEILITDENLLKDRNFPRWVPHDQLARYIPMIGQISDVSHYNLPVLRHGSALLLKSVIHGVVSPDVSLRAPAYETVRFDWLSIKWNKRSKEDLRDPILKNLDKELIPVIGKKNFRVVRLMIEGTELYDRIFDFGLAEKLRNQLGNFEDDTRKRLGSQGQFPVAEFPDALVPGLLVDLRSVAEGNSMISHHLIDPTNRNVLWLVLRPIIGRDLAIHRLPNPRSDGKYFSVGHTRLIALDCISGKILHNIDLAELPGLWPGKAPATWPLNNLNQGVWPERKYSPGLIANDTHLFIQFRAGWGRDTVATVVLVNRATGEIEELPKEVQMVEDLQNGPGVVGIGDSFYVVTSKNESNASLRVSVQSLWRIRSGQPPVLLSRSGRRPEISPFDALDLPITQAWRDESKMLLGSNQNYFALYDTDKKSWHGGLWNTPKVAYWSVHEVERKIYHGKLFPQHIIKLADDTQRWFINSRETKAGLLNFSDEKRSYNLPVTLGVPDDFDSRYRIYTKAEERALSRSELERGGFEWVDAKDFSRTSMMVPEILNQTETHLVLGMRMASTIRGETGIENIRLPFIWAVEKDLVETAIKRVEKSK